VKQFIHYDAVSSRLAELSKTDRQLITPISNRLERGLAFARLYLDDESRSRWASVEEFYRRAESAYAESQMWLPWVRDLTATDRRRLESKLVLLRAMLDQQSPCAAGRAQAACS